MSIYLSYDLIICEILYFPDIQGYEMVLDMPTSCQWSFDVSFCPRNPIVLSTSSFDGRISLYSLAGGSQQPVTSSKLADSFPGMDLDMSHTPVPAQKPISLNLRDAPKWLKRPCGASFAVSPQLQFIQHSNIQLNYLTKSQSSIFCFLPVRWETNSIREHKTRRWRGCSGKEDRDRVPSCNSSRIYYKVTETRECLRVWCHGGVLSGKGKSWISKYLTAFPYVRSL
jgi:hypothetical protein